jgi:hypothetical protein
MATSRHLRPPSQDHERCRLAGDPPSWTAPQVREQAHVTELTELLLAGPDGEQLKAWPRGMRVFARRERPRPARICPCSRRSTGGATRNESPDEEMTGPVRLRRRRPLGPRPGSRTSSAPGRSAEADGPGRRPGESRAGDAALPPPARSRPPRPRWTRPDPEDRRDLALDRRGGPTRSPPPGSGSRQYRSQADQQGPSQRERKAPWGPWNPGHPAPQLGRRHTPL